MKLHNSLFALFLAALFFLLWVGCSQTNGPQSVAQTEDEVLRDIERQSCSPDPCLPPTELVTVGVGDDLLEFWPYTGVDFSATPQDPINLIFYGKADPRDIMSALLSLDGDRSAFGFPPVAPFNLTWSDAIGDMQAGYGNNDWTGSAVQLALGSYEEPRFHIRLFKMGDWTVANAHFEVLIPGTADHQVLSWELAEQLIITDFMRSGLLDETMPVIPTLGINLPNFREIPVLIYNGLPVELRMLIGCPLNNVASPVPIPSDGHAVILNLADKVDWQTDTRVKDFVLYYDQVFPRPFCSLGEYDYVYVTGPVHLRQTVRFDRHGVYSLTFNASGSLEVTPFDPITGQPTGESLTAKVKQRHRGLLSDSRCNADGMIFQIIMPVDEPGGGWYYNRLRVNTTGNNFFQNRTNCGGSE
jgi:hypothetical protein